MTAIRMSWDTGLRSCDLLDLAPDQIREGMVSTRQSKTGQLICHRLHKSTLEAIEAIDPSERVLIFPWPNRREAFQRAVRRLTKRAGMTGTFKWLRKSSGSYVEASHPGCGSRHLGHRDSTMFDKHYHDQTLTAASKPMPPELEGGAS